MPDILLSAIIGFDQFNSAALAFVLVLQRPRKHGESITSGSESERRQEEGRSDEKSVHVYDFLMNPSRGRSMFWMDDIQLSSLRVMSGTQ